MKFTIKELKNINKQVKDTLMQSKDANINIEQLYSNQIKLFIKLSAFFTKLDESLLIVGYKATDDGEFGKEKIIVRSMTEYGYFNMINLQVFYNTISSSIEKITLLDDSGSNCIVIQFPSHEQDKFYNFLAKDFERTCNEYPSKISKDDKNKMIDIVKSKNLSLAIELFKSHFDNK